MKPKKSFNDDKTIKSGVNKETQKSEAKIEGVKYEIPGEDKTGPQPSQIITADGRDPISKKGQDITLPEAV